MSEQERNKDGMTADIKQIGEALKQSLPGVDTELGRDLWPAVLRRLEERPARALWSAVPWYDWALMGASAAVFAFFPRLTLMLAYHL
jgi:hypothetical protein